MLISNIFVKHVRSKNYNEAFTATLIMKLFRKYDLIFSGGWFFKVFKYIKTFYITVFE